MKNKFLLIKITLICFFVITSCNKEVDIDDISINTIIYQIGDIGPAGGYIFYDKGFSSDGWRYLEAAPENSEFTAEWGVYIMIESELKTHPGITHYVEKKLFVSGTSMLIGTGKENTELILAKLKMTGEKGRAAQQCISLNIADKTDWFLPSLFELGYMYENLHKQGLGGFKDGKKGIYWSSSEISPGGLINVRDFRDGVSDYEVNYRKHLVRACRRF